VNRLTKRSDVAHERLGDQGIGKGLELGVEDGLEPTPTLLALRAELAREQACRCSWVSSAKSIPAGTSTSWRRVWAARPYALSVSQLAASIRSRRLALLSLKTPSMKSAISSPSRVSSRIRATSPFELGLPPGFR
jgi:hypothetical protein